MVTYDNGWGTAQRTDADPALLRHWNITRWRLNLIAGWIELINRKLPAALTYLHTISSVDEAFIPIGVLIIEAVKRYNGEWYYKWNASLHQFYENQGPTNPLYVPKVVNAGKAGGFLPQDYVIPNNVPAP
jgi:hypothetical protein